MSTPQQTISITIEEYAQLKRDSEILQALRKAGVDNWEWYDDALSTLSEKDE